MWGFFGKREDETRFILTADIREVDALLANSDIEITFLGLIGEGRMLQVEYRSLKEKLPSKGNVMLAAMTTAYARIHLYKLISRFGPHVVYFDTDSIVLALPPGVDPPDTSNLIGGLKDEVSDAYGTGHSISSFVSTGPKCYSFDVVNTATGKRVDTVAKYKGIRVSLLTLCYPT